MPQHQYTDKIQCFLRMFSMICGGCCCCCRRLSLTPVKKIYVVLVAPLLLEICTLFLEGSRRLLRPQLMLFGSLVKQASIRKGVYTCMYTRVFQPNGAIGRAGPREVPARRPTILEFNHNAWQDVRSLCQARAHIFVLFSGTLLGLMAPGAEGGKRILPF